MFGNRIGSGGAALSGSRWADQRTDSHGTSYALLGVIVVALLAGVVVPFYAGAMDYKFARLLVLPALLLFGFLLMFNRLLLLTLIIVFRSAGDIVLETTRFSIGGYETGVGGVINLCVIMLACMLVVENPHRLPKKVVMAWLPFILVATAGVAVSPEKGDAIRTWLTMLSYFAIFASAFYFVRVPVDFRRCVKLVLWSSAIPALYAPVDILLNAGAGGPEGFRLQSTFTHPNIMAFYLMLIIPLTLFMLKDRATRLSSAGRIGLMLYMVYLLGLLILTQTRSAWIACLVMFISYALLFERRYLIYLMLLPVVALLVPEVRDRLVDLGSGNEAVGYAKLNSFAWRLSIWESGLQWMQPSHYLFGYGVDAFRHYSQTFFPAAGKISWGAHNVYVQWFFDAGVIGLLTYLWLYGRVTFFIKTLVRRDKLAAFIAIAIVIMYLVSSASDNMFGYLVFNWYFWFTVGAACALAARAQARSARADADAGQNAGGNVGANAATNAAANARRRRSSEAGRA
ncbi:MAG TPA: O-antigen ligase family protein [Oxalicibacterium sp.]|uniref:O-antigen ligase family protein n=1 Tax=Oxalicibacterium sp. TaxID=2766525 RepID=UPI002C2F64C2|nr:O-antigen ligase family protein [Oxalicibacterium sp.]HWU97505.1 O-antigen ligase family protein [Oxalicibacterium sp.]